MTKSEPFNFITTTKDGIPQLFDEYHELSSAHYVSVDVQLVTELRKQHPDLIVTTVPASNCNLTQYALAGNAAIELDIETDNIIRYRGFIPSPKRGLEGSLGESVSFAKFRYSWNNINFILYTIGSAINGTQYILTEPRENETQLGTSAVTDALLKAIGEWLTSDQDVVYVFDGSWQKSKDLWNEVQKAKWEDVILDPNMKKELIEVANKFFDSEDIYKQFGVPWKRGLIFYGPVGNGKTVSIKALMHSLYQRKDLIPSLYVKSVYGAYQVRSIFVMARNMAPCMLIMEDMETVVYGGSRSYFFNEVDGLENNNGILMLGSTNYLERLDPGITKRPSRFDRKYLFPLPTNEEREQYCRYWRKKIMKNPQVDYPKKLVRLIAAITFGFSFAYLQEAFVATLLELARQQAIDGSAIQAAIKSATLDNMEEAWGGEDDTNKSDNNDDDNDDDDDDDIEKLPFWRTIRQQVEILRDDLQRQSQASNEQEHGFFATPRKYFDAVFGGLYQGVSKYMFGALGANPDNLGSSNMTQMDHWNESKGELPGLPAVLAKGESVRGTGRATSGHLDLPALSSPRNMG